MYYTIRKSSRYVISVWFHKILWTFLCPRTLPARCIFTKYMFSNDAQWNNQCQIKSSHSNFIIWNEQNDLSIGLFRFCCYRKTCNQLMQSEIMIVVPTAISVQLVIWRMHRDLSAALFWSRFYRTHIFKYCGVNHLF